MSIYGYDTATGLFEVRNPWGVETGQYWDTTFEVSLNTLLTDGDTVTTDNVGKATSVNGASVVAAGALQKMTQVKSFGVSDSVADVDNGLSGLIGDSKLGSVSVNGTTGVDLLSLTGLTAAATINLDGDFDKATVTGFSATSPSTALAKSLNLGSSYDTVALGSGHATIDFAFGSGGVEDVTKFNAAYDMLSIALNGGSLQQTLVGGGDWISSSNLTQGVFLAGVSTLQQVSSAGGMATVV